ncbi:STAS domain-containing protein [Streptomyces sp. NPDC059525]|uniref:STAS domain-containing protein n=1 Tax=Streptomyces sp. NPDC059525 TaxID=3346857 RepID=UPI0036B437C7
MPAAPFSLAVTTVCPGWAVIAVAGELDMDTSPHFAQAVEALPAEGLMSVDLSAVTFMDSEGLNTLLRIRRRLCGEGVALELCGVSDRVRRVLELTGTMSLFTLKAPPCLPQTAR